MEQEKRAHVTIDVALHRRLKVYAAQHGTTIRKLMEDAARAILGEKGWKKPKE